MAEAPKYPCSRETGCAICAVDGNTYFVRHDRHSKQRRIILPLSLDHSLSTLSRPTPSSSPPTTVVRDRFMLLISPPRPCPPAPRQIHAVGRAAGAGREPRLLDLTWTPRNSEGNPNLPKVRQEAGTTLGSRHYCTSTTVPLDHMFTNLSAASRAD